MKILFFIVFLIGCQSVSKECIESDSFDESQYTLDTTKYFDQGGKSEEIFRHKSDINKRLVKLFYENGNIQTSIFYSNSKKDGPAKLFDPEGNLVVEAMYLKNVQNGITFYYKRGQVVEYAVFYQGKEMPLDSSTKRRMMKSFE